MKAPDLTGLSVGDELPVMHKRATRAQLFLYSAASHNPHRIHYDRDYAELEGHADILVHGPLQGSWLTQYLTDWIGPRGRLVSVTWQNRGHFYMAASRAMHDVLVERARSASRKKRGGGLKRVPLNDAAISGSEAERFLELHEALEQLCRIDTKRADVVRLRFFCGLTNHEIAAALGCTERTIRREWTVAKVWLKAKLGAGHADISGGHSF